MGDCWHGQFGAVHVRIVKTVTRARYDDTGQLDTTGEDEGGWYMD